MKIEVATNKNDTTKDKGDLLENLSGKLLSAQNYEVIKEIRFTAVELDLLCKHKVSYKEIYVECKALRRNIDANILKNLLGTLELKNYSEAWLISTSEFGKEAKGFEYEWNQKPPNESSRLSFYTPDKVIEALKNSKIIVCPPKNDLLNIVKDQNIIGEWTLLITKYGIFWAATCLSAGIPTGVILFHSNNGAIIEDEELLKNLALTDTTLNELDFTSIKKFREPTNAKSPKIIDVIQIQHGDSWDDYRPARPEDFVGRRKNQEKIFSLFSKIRKKETSTRIFAITGNSGMGKSSLINKIKSKSENKLQKKKLFIFAVDVRAAVSSDYIYSSLLTCLKIAQKNGFGKQNCELRITDVSNPISSTEIKEYIQSLEEKEQLICLVFDQFEELYSKPELYEVFEKAKNLFFGTNSLQSNFCMGFAWKSDNTMHQEHPAYFMWHELQDLRVTYKLQPFTDGESNAALNIFEKEIEQELHSDLRHNLLKISQGYPWSLKKFCIHLYNKIKQGVNQNQLLENKLDVKKLFDDDLSQLNQPERACLELIANRAPIDWFEVTEVSGDKTLQALINKRLVIKSGDRLNIYWDIFREYLLTKNVPVIPLHYLPTNDFSSISKIGSKLKHDTRISIKELADEAELSENTVQNISSDLVMFEIAFRESGNLVLNPDISYPDETSLLKKAREKIKRHAFTIGLFKKPANTEVTIEECVELLKEIFSNSDFTEKTWRTYTLRLCRWLELCGFLTYTYDSWLIQDSGKVEISVKRRRGSGTKKIITFTAPTSPALTLEALKWVKTQEIINKNQKLPKGYRNAFVVLRRFNLLIRNTEKNYVPNYDKIIQFGGELEALWAVANSEATLIEVKELIQTNPKITGLEIGEYLNKKYSLNWLYSSKKRNGAGIKRWCEWILKGKHFDHIPSLPGRTYKNNNLKLNFD